MLPLNDTILFLPLSEALLDELLNEERPLADSLAAKRGDFGVPQLAALIVVQCLGAGKPVPLPGQMLAQAISLGNQWVRRSGLAAFVGYTQAALDRPQLEAGRQLLPQRGIALMAPEDLKPRHYLTPEGEWDSGFLTRYRDQRLAAARRVVISGELRTLTAEQGRVYREAEASPDEHLHVQGYAGIGKSLLVTALLSMLASKGARIALVAERQVQLEALLSRAGAGSGGLPGVVPRTFGQLMEEVTPPDLSNPSYRHMRRWGTRPELPDESLARHLGIYASATLSAAAIARIVRGTVSAFCRSDAAEIGRAHIPTSAPVLDAATGQVVLHHATELWKATVLPGLGDFRPPVRDYHRIKWAALNGWRIPERYTHVLMDEGHDLPRPLLQLVENSSQAVITLGDEYQNLRARPQYRAPGIRQRELVVSVRSGAVIEAIVNPLIAAHPGRTKLPFIGNPARSLSLHYYDKAQAPAGPVLVLVNDEWGLFEWAQRLSLAGELVLLSSAHTLDRFVTDCIELHRHGTRPRHGALYRYGSWQQLAAAYSDHPGFRRIDRMLGKGYTPQDWARTLERAKGGPAAPRLAIIEDVRNREFASVMLAPDVADWAWRTRPGARAEAASAIYVAVTRATERLYLPRNLETWLEDLEPA